MNAIERARLETLIEFLENDLTEDQFYFNEVVSAFDPHHQCGTMCCAIGWTPKLFPDLVHWFNRTNLMVNGEVKTYGEVANHLFGLPVLLSGNLFAPDHQPMVHSALRDCDEASRPWEVAEMLTEFLALVDAGEIKLEVEA